MFTALLSYLYSKAAIYQVTTDIATPEKAQTLEMLEEIQDQVR